MQKILLIQIRDEQVMANHERDCILRVLGVSPEQLDTHNIVEKPLSSEVVQTYRGLIIGGSGDHSVFAAPNRESLDTVLAKAMDRKMPILGLCWGAQYLALRLGGEVGSDPSRKELGTVLITCTDAAKSDPVFASLPHTFLAQEGHNQSISHIPPNATLLASSAACPVQAFRVGEELVYGLQFHPELRREDLVFRLEHYKAHYVQGGSSEVDRLINSLEDTTLSENVARRWLALTLA